MHLIEQYSISTGLKIHNPYIYVKYYPLSFDKYIVIHLSSKDNLRDYSYWNEVLWLIKPYLSDYKIVQVGVKNDPPIQCDLDLRDKTEMSQLAYVIKNASLFIGVDSFPAHLAGYFKIPMVSIYSNSYISCVRPYWGDKTKQMLIETHRPNGEKPSFSFHENPKTIDRIKPEEIASAIFSLKNIPPKSEVKSLYFGERYRSVILDFVPNFVAPAEFNPQIVPHIRYDYVGPEFENNVYSQVFTRKSVIITDKPLNVDILKKIRSNIAQIVVDISDDKLADFVKGINFSGIPYVLISYLEEDALKKLKLLYCDFNPILRQVHKTKENFYKENLNYNNIFFKTNKYLFSDSKCYINKAYWLKNIEHDNSDEKKYIDLGELQSEFWKDGDFFYFYQKLDKQ